MHDWQLYEYAQKRLCELSKVTLRSTTNDLLGRVVPSILYSKRIGFLFLMKLIIEQLSKCSGSILIHELDMLERSLSHYSHYYPSVLFNLKPWSAKFARGFCNISFSKSKFLASLIKLCIFLDTSCYHQNYQPLVLYKSPWLSKLFSEKILYPEQNHQFANKIAIMTQSIPGSLHNTSSSRGSLGFHIIDIPITFLVIDRLNHYRIAGKLLNK